MKKRIEIIRKQHEYQRRFYENPARFRALFSGVGGGKTYAGVLEAIYTALQYPHTLGAVIAPTYRMLQDTVLRTFFENCPRELVKAWNKSENRVELMNHSEIIFRSAEDPEKLRGPNLGWFWMDEAAICPEMSWRIMLGRLRLQPERAWVTTTPKGFNWPYTVFVKNPQEHPELNVDYWFCNYASRYNPGLSDTFLRSLEQSYRGVFYRQEVLGEFVGHEGLVYPGFSRAVHVVRELPPLQDFLGAADFGFTNPAVYLVVGQDSDGRLYVVEELYQSALGIEEYVKQAKILKERYGIREGYGDPASPEYIDSLNRAGVSMQGVKREVMEGISIITARLGKAGDGLPRLFVHERCLNTLMEFENYSYPEKKEDKPVQEKPEKVHDHALDSLSYLCYALHARSEVRTIGDLTALTSRR